MAAWKLAPALAAGNCVVLKPAEQTPVGILLVLELIQDILPAGVLNVVNGYGAEVGRPLATNPRIAKIAFTGSTQVGQLIMQYATENIIPVTLELGGKSPNIFFEDVMDKEDDFLDKALEGFAMFALNQGEVCTCPSRALVQESIADKFLEKAIERVKRIKVGHPLDTETMVGAQASQEQQEKSYVVLTQVEKKVLNFLRVVVLDKKWVKVSISNQLSSKDTTRCRSSKKKFLDQFYLSPRSKTLMKQSKSQMTPSMV
jgi:aldehyde dehydrogenase